MVRRAVACGKRPKKVSDYERGLADGAKLEREQCAIMCEQVANTFTRPSRDMSDVCRDFPLWGAAMDCALAIRARSK